MTKNTPFDNVNIVSSSDVMWISHFRIAEASAGSYATFALLRWSLAVIFIWFGAMKFTSYEASGISPFIVNSPFMSWLDVLFGQRGASAVVGALELLTALVLIVGSFFPIASVIGATMSGMTYLITLSFLLTTPGVAEPAAGGFPAISASIGQFLLKDLVLLAASICLFFASVHWERDAR